MAKKVTVKKPAPAKPVKKSAAKPAPAKPAKKKPTPKPAPKADKPPKAKSSRLVSYWDIYTSTLKRVARFPYAERIEADKKCGKLKGIHFVQLVKEIVDG